MIRHLGWVATLLVFSPLLAAEPGSREAKVRADREKVQAAGFWIYNDLPKAIESAKQSGKPILVSLRCIPCEECVKLDDDLVDNDPVIRPLLEKFVCVRIVGTNGLDLDTFQFDTDQSFAMFMINADKTIYGRFGTRSHRTDWIGDVSLKGMAAALRGALELHAESPANRTQLAGKTGEPLEYASPEKYPSLASKYTDRLNYEGDVVKSCIHCHQIGDARRDFYRARKLPIPEKLLFPYPHPKSIGLVLDPNHRAVVKAVLPDSPAVSADLRPDDEILTMNGQPLLSMADVQWILHHQPSGPGRVEMEIRREDREFLTSLELPEGWRRLDDPRWRVASWGMGRMMTGGMRLQALDDDERKELNIDVPGMALRATSVGKYGPHATARRAGFRVDDIIIAYDGRTDLMREADVFAYANENRVAGEKVSIKILRNGRTEELTLPLQD